MAVIVRAECSASGEALGDIISAEIQHQINNTLDCGRE